MDRVRYYILDGIIQTPIDINENRLFKEFTNFLEEKGYNFGGEMCEIDKTGNPILEKNLTK